MPNSLKPIAGALVAALMAGAAHAASPSDIAAGKKIAFSRNEGNCVACHSLPGAAMPGNIGPALGPWIKTVFPTKADLVRYLDDPQAKIPHVVMPEFGKNGVLTEQELQRVGDYLLSLKNTGTAAAAAPPAPASWWKLGEPGAKPAESRARILAFYRHSFPSLSLQDYALGSGALNKELREQDEQLASFSPAGFVLDKGKQLWHQPFPDGKTYASCYPKGGEGAAAHYPYYSVERHEVVTLPISLNDCRKANGLAPLPYGKPDIVALETYLASLSNGVPLEVKADSPGAAAAFQAGQKKFFQPEGKLGLACASCHFGAAGHYLRAQLLSAALGMTVTFPKYRVKWGQVGTLHRRFRGCQTNIQAKPEPFESADYRNLEFFLAYLGNGIKIDVPGNGP